MAGPAVIGSYEEQPGPALASRLARCGAKRDDLHIIGRCGLDRLAEFVQEKRAVALVVDSVQVAGIRPRDLRKLMTLIPRLSVLVAVSQVNKLGEISGTNELAHESDVVVHCADMMWTLRKSRYEPTPTEPQMILDLARTNDAQEE
jgi:predicted ATP-dependent serine protease